MYMKQGEGFVSFSPVNQFVGATRMSKMALQLLLTICMIGQNDV